jgi:flagellar biosynthesis/type III secretory pathway M-ring protein FliF/YscJ
LAPPTETAESVRERALEIASQDPATAAMILREWLNAPSASAPTALSQF